ncbi:MAG: FtsQ-type POTRA domain-containing protein [Actinomycetota bacterium]|nr:FtsQ-type POTRA domain-containing protein [Actinomycetota bacterium]
MSARAVLSDPRLRARKIAVARQAGHRRLAILGGFLAAVALVVATLVVLHSPLLSARAISISGASHERQSELLAVTGLDRHPPLIDLNLAAEEAAIERLPWVARATVTRHWPSAVSIAITERRPLAEVELGPTSYALIDRSGRVLADTTASTPDLAPLSGVGVVPAPGGYLAPSEQAVLTLARALPVALLSRVAWLGERPGDGLVIQLRHAPLVIIGAPSALREKMISLVTLLDRAQVAGFATIDLRVAASPVLTH